VTALPFAFAVLVGMAQTQSRDDLRDLTLVGSDSVLFARVHDRPDDVRDTLRRLFSQAATDTQPAEALAAAGRLAQAYSVVWRDSFFVRRVALFVSWSTSARREKVAADSLRLAGNAALGRSGVDAALRLWRESLRRCAALDDSAGVGAALGNIGAGFYRADNLDSAALYLGRARAIAERVGDYRTAGNAVGVLASLYADRGELRKSAELYARAAEIRSLTGDDRGAAADRNNLGLVSQGLGDLEQARRAFSEALASNRSAGRTEPAAVNLINLGNLASLEGEYPQAAIHYREALGLYRRLENRVGRAAVLHDLGLLELQRGAYRAALSNLSQALTIYRLTGPIIDEVAVRRDIATAHAAMGSLQGALNQLGRAERLATSASDPRLLAQLALAHADLAVQFNAFPEAERQYGRAVQLSRRSGDRRGAADAERGLGLLLLLRDDNPRAQARLELALRAAEVAGDARSIALTRLLLGYAQMQRGDTGGARGSLTRAGMQLHALGDRPSEAAALGTLAALEQQGGVPLAAESLYRRGLDLLPTGLAPTVSWQLRAGLADALQSRGGRDEATQELRLAAREIDRISGTLPLEERRAAFLADKWDVYVQLALGEFARGQTDAAFEASEQLRARQLLDLLARGRIAVDEGPEGLVDTLAAREQDLRRHIGALTRALEGQGAATAGLRGPLSTDSASGAVREALARAQDVYAALLLQIREARPEYATLVAGAIAPVRAVMAQLAPDEALLEYLVGDSASVVFVVTRDTVAAIELGVARHELAMLVDFSRSVLTRPVRGSTSGWRAPLRRLYGYLIEPVEASGLLVGKHGLVVAPHAELHYAPFAALLGPREYVIQRYRLTYTPSGSVWLRLHDRAPPVGSGVLALAPRVDVLPGSAAEVAAIGRLYGTDARVLVGAHASKRALRDAAAGQSIIHFATYGVLNKDNPLFSFVELSPQGGDDGRLEVHEVFGLRLRARLVVLSACRTALGAGALADVPAGDDWVGLVQGFLYAGASNVMATLWPVQDRATADLMTRFYTALRAGRPEAEALAEAQRGMLRNPRTAHPFYWAGFTLSGGQ
jgi:CHAT domain-containing protein/Tfp pilus assembly protein PilF